MESFKYLKSTERAVFNPESKIMMDREGRLKVGRLSAGDFVINEKGLEQFKRLRRLLNQLPNLCLIDFPHIHMLALRIDSTIYKNEALVQQLVVDIKKLALEVHDEDKEVLLTVYDSAKSLMALIFPNQAKDTSEHEISVSLN